MDTLMLDFYRGHAYSIEQTDKQMFEIEILLSRGRMHKHTVECVDMRAAQVLARRAIVEL